MRLGQVWSRTNQVQANEKQAGPPQKRQSAPVEDETESVGRENGQAPVHSAVETAVRQRPELSQSPRDTASLPSSDEQVEFELPLIDPAAARSIRETALLEFL